MIYSNYLSNYVKMAYIIILYNIGNIDVMGQIGELIGKIRELVEQESLRLVRGKMLYDEIKLHRLL